MQWRGSTKMDEGGGLLHHAASASSCMGRNLAWSSAVGSEVDEPWERRFLGGVGAVGL